LVSTNSLVEREEADLVGPQRPHRRLLRPAGRLYREGKNDRPNDCSVHNEPLAGARRLQMWPAHCKRTCGRQPAIAVNRGGGVATRDPGGRGRSPRPELAVVHEPRRCSYDACFF